MGPRVGRSESRVSGLCMAVGQARCPEHREREAERGRKTSGEYVLPPKYAYSLSVQTQENTVIIHG